MGGLLRVRDIGTTSPGRALTGVTATCAAAFGRAGQVAYGLTFSSQHLLVLGAMRLLLHQLLLLLLLLL